MGLINHGKIHVHNNALDGLHVGEGGKVENLGSGEIDSHDNGRHGVFVAEDIATLKANIAEASALLNTEDLRSFQQELQPLFDKVTQELDAPKVNAADVQSTLSKTLAYLAAVGQGIVGNIMYNQLPDFIQLKHLIEAGVQLLQS